MIILKAFTNVLILPNPKLGDSNTGIRELNIQRSINGVPYSYVKTTGNIRLLFQIEMTRMKSLELEAFIKTYGGNKWELIDHNGTKYQVISVTNLVKQNFKRNWYKPNDPQGSEEAVEISMELEGTPL